MLPPHEAAPNLYLGAPTIRLFVKPANALNQRANHSGSIVVCKRKSQREALREHCNLKWKNLERKIWKGSQEQNKNECGLAISGLQAGIIPMEN
jgi:hypothetical protein